MPLFTSSRERRLWLWTLAIVAGIYSTLGLARTLAAALQDSGLGVPLFILGCLLVLATVVTHGLTTKPSRLELAVALGVTATYLLVFVRMTIPTERSHLIEYSVVAVFIYQALTERRRNGRRVPAPPALAVAGTAALGALDEGIQAMLPNRVYDIRDIGFNALAGVMAIAASLALSWARRPGA